MIDKLLLISFSQITLLWIIMYLLIILINYTDMQKKKKFNVEELKKDKVLAQIYLDQYYITNKYYTFFITFLYIVGMILIFVFLRYLAINTVVLLTPQESLYHTFVSLFIIYSLVLITIVLYRSLLTILCKKELNKFYLYINHYCWLDKINDIFRYKLGEKILGPLYLITYRISTFEYKYPFYGKEYDVAHRFILDDEPDYIIDNQILIDYAYAATNYARKYAIVQRFFNILSSIFRFCFKHISKLNELFPHFILACTFMIELYNKTFHHVYLILFIVLIIKTKRDFIKFKRSRYYANDYSLSTYFYKNKIPYEKQRLSYHITDKINIYKSVDSQQNYWLFIDLREIIDYTFNDFKWKFHSTTVIAEERKEKGMYRRFWVIIGLILISPFILEINWKMIVLLFPIPFIIYAHYNTYYTYEFQSMPDLDNYAYNKRYNVMFWIFTIIQGYIFWLLLLKPELIFMETEVLLKLPYNMGEFIRVYSIEEKIMYLYNYFEYYIDAINNKLVDKDYIRYLLREINFKELINDTVKLKDIKVYVKLVIETYVTQEHIYEMLKEHVSKTNKPENPWYNLLYNTLLIGALTSTLLNINNFWIILKKINTPKDTYVIINQLLKEIYLGTLKDKMTKDILKDIIIRIFK